MKYFEICMFSENSFFKNQSKNIPHKNNNKKKTSNQFLFYAPPNHPYLF